MTIQSCQPTALPSRQWPDSIEKDLQGQRPGQGCRKFRTVRYIEILNPKLSDKMPEILRHFSKVSKKSKLCLYTLQDNYIVKLLTDCWTQHCPTIGQFETALSDHWRVEQSTV